MPAELNVLEWSTRLVVAALLSGLVGFERQAKHKAAGLRTHMLVGLGAALFTLVSEYGFDTGDDARVAAQIVTGVGFLGAGAIFRQGVTVRGLTTAAGLWAVAAIGMTAGTGLIAGAFVTTAIALVILYGLSWIQAFMRARFAIGEQRLIGVTLARLDELPSIIALVTALDDDVGRVDVHRTGDTFSLTIAVAPDRLDPVTTGVRSFDSVVEANEIDPN